MAYPARYRYDNKKKKETTIPVMLVGMIVFLCFIVALKFTTILTLLGIVDKTYWDNKGEFQAKAAPVEPIVSEFERKQAERWALAKQQEKDRAAREKTHQEELRKKQAEEKTFDSWYKPPAICNNTNRWDVSVKCANAYMQAKSYFIEHKLGQW